MKQGNPTRKMGRIAYLMAVIGGMFGSSTSQRMDAMKQKDNLLLNRGGFSQRRELNQRQKRKRYRQSHTCK
jgi:hypothetical protein